MDKKNVLLVDDEEDLLKIIGSRIKKWGYSLTEAKNGKEALKSVKDKKPDIIVLDYLLPDMNGIAVLEQLRQIDKEVPVVMFTAYPTPKTMHEAEKFGISAFVPKFNVYTDIQSVLKSAIKMALKNP